MNRTGKDGYGPCPPHGDAAHHYVVQAYALELPGMPCRQRSVATD
ncbi:hypothetical protein [Paraburkholderia sediminicola]